MEKEAKVQQQLLSSLLTPIHMYLHILDENNNNPCQLSLNICYLVVIMDWFILPNECFSFLVHAYYVYHILGLD